MVWFVSLQIKFISVLQRYFANISITCLQREKTYHKTRMPRAVSSKYSLYAQWIDKDSRLLQSDSENSDQTARMRRLIWVFAVRTCQTLHPVAYMNMFTTYLRYCILLCHKQNNKLFLPLNGIFKSMMKRNVIAYVYKMRSNKFLVK